ncbi:amidase [Gordonia sinesedis]
MHAFTDDALGDRDAVGVAALIAAGDISAVEAAEAALARIDAVNPTLNAVAVDDRERARKRAVDNTFPAGVFAGVPSLIKNNTKFVGLPTRHGSAATADTPATTNEAFTEQFLAAGLNVLGASTMPEFGLTATTEYAGAPPTRNPWDTDYSAGGSSGGSAALVAAGAVPIAHANDGGGSIRIPAAACGLVGLKPTRDRMASAVEASAMPIDLIANGVVSRTVRDTAAFLADAERYRPVTALPPIGNVEGPADRRLRIAMLVEPITSERLDADTKAATLATSELLESLGHRTEFIPVPVDADYIDQFTEYWALMAFAIDHFGSRIAGKGFDRRKLDPFTRGLSRMWLRRFYRTPWVVRELRRATSQLRSVFDRFDVVMSPTMAHTTPEIGYLDPGGDFDEIFGRLLRYIAFTPASNASGLPGVSLPLATSTGGLPIGIHFSTDLGDERTLLELAYELEAARPFARIQN